VGLEPITLGWLGGALPTLPSQSTHSIQIWVWREGGQGRDLASYLNNQSLLLSLVIFHFIVKNTPLKLFYKKGTGFFFPEDGSTLMLLFITLTM
jgi:hypothetical protein